MAWEWLAPVANTLFTIWQTTATVATGAVCPPCVPVVTGVFTLGGMALKEGLKGLDGGDQGTGTDVGIPGMTAADNFTHAQLAYINSHLENITDIVTENQGMIRDVQRMINASAVENRMKKFEQNMNQQFLELKEFITLKSFIEHIEIPIQLLWRRMEKASESQTKADIDYFIDLYKEKSASRILEEFIVRLPHIHTNPVFTAMESKVGESRRVMEDFLHLISHFFVKVLAIEGFYNGVAGVNSTDYMDRLSAHINTEVLVVRDFVSDHKMEEEKYWPGEVRNIINRNLHGTETEIADRVLQQIKGIFTKDVFTILVWSQGPNNWAYPIYNWLRPQDLQKYPEFKSEGQVNAKFVNPSGATTNVFVMRSTRFHDIPAETYSLVRAAYRAHAYTHKVIFDKLNLTEASNLYGMSYISHHEDYFPDSYLTHGFAVWGAGTVAARYTNEGYGILTDEDVRITDIYTGLSWV